MLASLLLLTASPAWAHAALLATQPPDGSTLSAAPGEIMLRFDEPVMLISLRLVGPRGLEVVPEAPPSMEGGNLRAKYPITLANGTYVLSYRIASADSHPVAGAIAFRIGDGAALAIQVPPNANRWIVPSQLVRWLFYMGLFAAAGGAIFRLVVAEFSSELRRALACSGAIAAVLAILQIGLRGALLIDADPPGLNALSAWSAGRQSMLFSSLLVSTAGLLVCSAALLGRTRGCRLVGAAGAIVALAGLPLSGHAATSPPRWLTAPALGLHVLAVAVWLGALLPLWMLLRSGGQPSGNALTIVRSFAARVVPAVALLLASGTLLAAVQVMRPAALVQSIYGGLLLAKLAGVVALLGLAAANRWYLTPWLATRPDTGPWRLRASIAAEIVAASGILAITALLTLTPPPRTLRSGYTTVITASSVRAEIAVMPAQAGWNQIAVRFNRAPREATLVMRQDTVGIGPIRRGLRPEADGRFVYGGDELAVSGTWSLQLEILLSEFDQVVLQTKVPVE